MKASFFSRKQIKLLETESLAEVQFAIGSCRFVSQSNYLNNSNKYVSCFPLHFFRALPLPACFTTEQSTVEASLFVKYPYNSYTLIPLYPHTLMPFIPLYPLYSFTLIPLISIYPYTLIPLYPLYPFTLLAGFHMTSLKFKLQNYWSSWDFTLMMYKSSWKLLFIQIFALNGFLVLWYTTLEFLSFCVTRHLQGGVESCHGG